MKLFLNNEKKPQMEVRRPNLLGGSIQRTSAVRTMGGNKQGGLTVLLNNEKKPQMEVRRPNLLGGSIQRTSAVRTMGGNKQGGLTVLLHVHDVNMYKI